MQFKSKNAFTFGAKSMALRRTVKDGRRVLEKEGK
jgi:hypothetical protein